MRQIAHVLDRVVVELQCTGKTLEHLIRRSALPTLFQSQVILRADAGQHRDFLAAQAHYPPAVAVGQTYISGLQEVAPGPEKSRQPAWLGHTPTINQSLRTRVALQLPGMSTSTRRRILPGDATCFCLAGEA